MKTIIYSILFLVVSNSVQSQWIQRYNGTGNTDDIAYSTAVDTSGNVYVTGKSKGIGTGF
ncbi:MAG: SBBP repeat-containing protein [Ignavibacteria bacterium]|nr:SBBP repeat-containing protein [Ignavibacteria bacterium]